jgi:hypothetical protein
MTPPITLPTLECQEVVQLLNRKHANNLKGRRFEGSVEGDTLAVLVRITLRNASGSYYYPVEGRLDYSNQDMSAHDAALFLLDYLPLYFDEFFADDEGVFLPIDWANHECDEVKFQLKGQILNLEAERLADELLNKGNS